jgi:diaminohydroxyphosphoribosylaminopyrimidine deaminase / 5-amino-6-(5-phosphoribosylamino)uracil reductase
MTLHEKYMRRCIGLANLGAGQVAPNPMVGAALVFEDRIIGEGYHKKFGEAHAEPNCLASVKDEDRHLISQSTLYVSLEPCVHFGKTPPCVDLIIKNKIPRLVVGCRDPFVEVKDKGIEKLKEAGIEIDFALEKECRELNKRFMVFHEQHRPYIILKWAETADGFIGASPQNNPDSVRLMISNAFTNRVVHKWRSEEAAILIGTNTARMDDPQLTTRLWTGNNPLRLVVDMNLSLPASLKLFDQAAGTIVFNAIRHDLKDASSSPALREKTGVRFYQVTEDVSLPHQLTNALYHMRIQSVIVEGGPRLLQSFIDDGMWDEARIIKNEKLKIKNGFAAPVLDKCIKVSEEIVVSDKIGIFKEPGR